jgi:hypothetical protein
MKKFSKITNSTVSKEPIIKIEEDLNSKIKKNLLSIMNKTLRIQSYGSVDSRFLSGSVIVEGKELLAEAIIEFFNDISNNKSITLLESLKSEIKDWEAIDSKIAEITENQNNYLYTFKVKKLIERYKSDTELLKLILSEKMKYSSQEYKNIIISELKNIN